MIPDRLLENRQGALADLVLLKRTELSLVELGLGNVYVLTAGHSKDSQSGANYIEGGERHVPHSG